LSFSTQKNNISKNLQHEIFESNNFFSISSSNKQKLNHSPSSLIKWRKNIYEYQNKVIENLQKPILQKSLFKIDDDLDLIKINPFLLTSFSINFWRSNKSVDKGPAMYFVIDTIKTSKIILYIGETNSADKRWKGDHDCKNYISNYKETMSNNNLESNLDIRFFLDVPKEVKLRRKLEKRLIYLWLPPFNKETRDRWTTTFTNN
tara:strand:+ start:496 stop:1107 length:612 start_codon:yes stop_codon:yes gene_type:complete